MSRAVRMSDKKEEEKYCQENFNSEGDQTGKIAGGVIAGIVIIAAMVYMLWFFYTRKKRNKIKRIKELAQKEYTETCNRMDIAEAKPEHQELFSSNPVHRVTSKSEYNSCTCYYDDVYELIMGCTDKNFKLTKNEFYKTDLANAKIAKNAKK